MRSLASSRIAELNSSRSCAIQARYFLRLLKSRLNGLLDQANRSSRLNQFRDPMFHIQTQASLSLTTALGGPTLNVEGLHLNNSGFPVKGT